MNLSVRFHLTIGEGTGVQDVWMILLTLAIFGLFALAARWFEHW